MKALQEVKLVRAAVQQQQQQHNILSVGFLEPSGMSCLQDKVRYPKEEFLAAVSRK